MKKIALFSDGTGNSSSSPQKTNVWRAYKALDRSPASNQIAFYDNGVGTSPFTPTAVLGLAFGWGLARNVRQIYGFLCRTYKPGDEIYGFGFSRGAFTMRVAVALIASQGIIDPNTAKNERDLDRLIAAAYYRYRRESFTPSLLSFFLRPLRDLILKAWHRARGRKPYRPERNFGYPGIGDDEPLIKFVGVWDTVDAYGLPVDELTRAWDKVVWPLTAKDRNLSNRIERACQALALDEARESFEPMLWNENGAEIDNERLKQVWFAGVHSNVGGGYPDDALAFTTLNWILDESQKNGGLTFLSHERQGFTSQADVNGPGHNSRRGVGNLYRYAPRKLERLCQEKKPGLWNWLKGKMRMSDVASNEVNILKPKIHHSVFDRIAEGGDAYAPINVPADYAIVGNTGAVIDVQDSGPAAGSLPETPKQADERRRRQSYVWNKVWTRKLLYFLTLVAIICFVVYPYTKFASGNDGPGPVARHLEPFFGTFSGLIRSIPELIGKIPALGFAEGWAARYETSPFIFSLGILGIGGLILLSLKIRSALNSEMRANWYHVSNTGSPPASKVGPFRKKLAEFLEGPIYTSKITRPMRVGLEAFATLLFLLIVIAVGSRLFFVVADGFGGICGPNPQRQSAAFGTEFVFDPKDPCFDTGLPMKKGKKYVIEFSLPGKWKDEGIKADVNGWISTPWKMHLFTPLRRHLFAGWYQPIARIDEVLFDRYPLMDQCPVDRKKAQIENDNGKQKKLCMAFEARRDGRLYLYLNDAVLFTPHMPLDFYENNKGYANVTVTKQTRGK